MQLFLQPITEHDCEPLVPKCVYDWGFAQLSPIVKVEKGCELRCLLFSFAA
jgi:hypothetical protein